jgi:hypothetical protein
MRGTRPTLKEIREAAERLVSPSDSEGRHFPMARSASTPQALPLGSLTQPGARAGTACRECGSDRVTRISMALTDGSPVQFTSCHRCEHRTWEEQHAAAGAGAVLPVQRVLDKARKV